jgi:negative regulator of sigma E activity
VIDSGKMLSLLAPVVMKQLRPAYDFRKSGAARVAKQWNMVALQ